MQTIVVQQKAVHDGAPLSHYSYYHVNTDSNDESEDEDSDGA